MPAIHADIQFIEQKYVLNSARKIVSGQYIFGKQLMLEGQCSHV